MVTLEEVRQKLKECYDPELQLDVITLGLIYDIKIIDNKVHIKMTFTTPACPYGPFLLEDIKNKIRKIQNVKDVLIDITFNPPWQPNEELKALLGI